MIFEATTIMKYVSLLKKIESNDSNISEEEKNIRIPKLLNIGYLEILEMSEINGHDDSKRNVYKVTEEGKYFLESMDYFMNK